MKDKYIRKVQTSVTIFIHKDDDYLFLKRADNKRIDLGRLNGVGGRLEPGEDYLTAAIRETKEETGYVIKPTQISLAGVVKLEGGYQEDWVMCFLKVNVDNKELPKPNYEDGKFIWLDKDIVLDSNYELVDDLNYCFKDIVAAKHIFFLTAQIDEKHKIYSTSIGILNNAD